MDKRSQDEPFNNIHANLKKSRTALSDHYDVTIGSSAIFQKKMPLKRLNGRILRPVAFRPHLTMGLVLYRKDLGSQQANYAYQEQDMYILR